MSQKEKRINSELVIESNSHYFVIEVDLITDSSGNHSRIMLGREEAKELAVFLLEELLEDVHD